MATTPEKPAKPSEALSPNQLKEMYYFARLARDIEERLVILFRQSQVIGGLYRSLGQEGESVATAYALERTAASGLKNVSQPVIVGPISMLGDSIPVAAGIAIGARMRGRNLVAMAWIGDGATSTGAFH